MTDQQNERLNALMETEKGREFLYALAVNVHHIVFALSTEAERHRDFGMLGIHNELMDIANRIGRLAVETGAAHYVT